MKDKRPFWKVTFSNIVYDFSCEADRKRLGEQPLVIEGTFQASRADLAVAMQHNQVPPGVGIVSCTTKVEELKVRSDGKN